MDEAEESYECCRQEIGRHPISEDSRWFDEFRIACSPGDDVPPRGWGLAEKVAGKLAVRHFIIL